MNRLLASCRLWIAALLVLAAGFASPAQAIVVSPLSPPGPELFPGNSFVLAGPYVLPGSSFVDSYYFSLGTVSGVAVATARIDIPGTSQITQFYSTLFSNTGAIISGSDIGSVAPHQIGNSFVYGSLPQGDYRLEIGTLTGGLSTGTSGGSYLGALAVTPAIPEPEIWAMMAIGAGLVGWRTRRKTRA